MLNKQICAYFQYNLKMIKKLLLMIFCCFPYNVICRHATHFNQMGHIYSHFLILSKPSTAHHGELSSFHGTRNQRRKFKQLKTDLKVLMCNDQLLHQCRAKTLNYSCKSALTKCTWQKHSD